MNQPEYHKHPDATIDLRYNWADRFQSGETVANSRWSALGLSVVADQVIAAGTVTVAWVAGGLDRSRYYVTNAVSTSRGRTLMQDILLHVSEDVPLPESQL